MELLTLICERFNYQTKAAIRGFICHAYPIIILIHVCSAVFSRKSPDFILLAVQLIFWGIIHVWLYAAPKFYQRIMDLKNAFDDGTALDDDTAHETKHKSYQAQCMVHEDLLCQFKFRNTTLHQKIAKIGFLLGWGAVWIWCLFLLFYFELIPPTFLGISTAALFSTVIILNFSSYYSCILLVYFLRQVSNLPDIVSFPHNRYTPSSSKGFQHLLSNATISSMVFLTVSSLFTFVHLLLILNGPNLDKVQAHPVWFYSMTFITGLLGLGTFMVLYVAPKYFLRRILDKWKSASKNEFDAKLKDAESSKEEDEVDRYAARIERLQHDTLRSEYSLIEMTAAISTVAINIINSIVYIMTLQP